jgi:hypothetical protein
VNISGVIPGRVTGGKPGRECEYNIAEQSIVFMEDVSGGRIAEDAAGVTDVGLRFEALRSEALPKAASRDLIAKVAKEQWTA